MGKKQMIEYEIHGPKSQELSLKRVVLALQENRFPQAVLIDGAAGIGKKKLAIELMQALLCTHPEKRPCGKCFGCKSALAPEVAEQWLIPLKAEEAKAKTAEEMTSRSKSTSVEEFTSSYAKKILENPYAIDYLPPESIISIDLVRALNKKFTLRSPTARCVIIAEAERMNTEAANAFLKTLEEVPDNTYFILTTPSKDLLLETIRSRCSSIHLQTWTDEEIKYEFQKQFSREISPDNLGLCLGSFGRAIFFDEYIKSTSSLAVSFITLAYEKRYSDLFLLLQQAGSKIELDSALLLLDVLSFLLVDITRAQANLPLRLPETFSKIPVSLLEHTSPKSVQIALNKVQETSKILAGRSTSIMMTLQTLAIKLFDGEL